MPIFWACLIPRCWQSAAWLVCNDGKRRPNFSLQSESMMRFFNKWPSHTSTVCDQLANSILCDDSSDAHRAIFIRDYISTNRNNGVGCQQFWPQPIWTLVGTSLCVLFMLEWPKQPLWLKCEHSWVYKWVTGTALCCVICLCQTWYFSKVYVNLFKSPTVRWR